MFQVGDATPDVTFTPVFGLPVHLSRGTSVVCFLRPLTGASARVALRILTEAWPRFDAEGFNLVAVTRTDLTFARDYVPRYHVLFPVVADPDGVLFEQFGVQKDMGLVRSITGLRPRHWPVLSEGFSLGRQGNVAPGTDLPAWFVAREGRFTLAEYGRSALDLPSVEELWRATSH